LLVICGFKRHTMADIVLSSTEKGICHIAFVDPQKALSNIREQYPLANVIRKELPRHIEVLHIFDDSAQLKNPLHLHLKGTPFQLKVWEALLKVPKGCLTTYAHLRSEERRVGKV